MIKRPLEESPGLAKSAKRLRLTESTSIDILSLLSDEIILRVFSYLTPEELNTCQRYDLFSVFLPVTLLID
jgi:hypothetical protein